MILFNRLCMVRSYHGKSTRSHQNSEVKPRWAGPVLGWVTSREAPVLNCFLFSTALLFVPYNFTSQLHYHCWPRSSPRCWTAPSLFSSFSYIFSFITILFLSVFLFIVIIHYHICMRMGTRARRQPTSRFFWQVKRPCGPSDKADESSSSLEMEPQLLLASSLPSDGPWPVLELPTQRKHANHSRKSNFRRKRRN